MQQNSGDIDDLFESVLQQVKFEEFTQMTPDDLRNIVIEYTQQNTEVIEVCTVVLYIFILCTDTIEKLICLTLNYFLNFRRNAFKILDFVE